MASRYNLPHIDIGSLVSTHEYVGEQGFGSGAVRERAAHGQRIQNELRVSLSAADEAKPADGRLEPSEGAFVEVVLRRGTPPDILDMKTQDIRSSAAKTNESNDRTIALYVPDHARPVLETILSDYLEQDTDGGNPKNQGKVESIEAIRIARLETFW